MCSGSRIRGILRLCLLLAALDAWLQDAVAAGLEYPMSAVAAKDGAVYVADQYLPGVSRIRDGQAEVYFKAPKKFRTPLNSVRAVAFDAQGRLLVSDAATSEVYRFDKSGKPAPLTGGAVGVPNDVAVDAAGTIFVADLAMHCIWRVASDGGKPKKVADVTAPRGLAVDSKGNLWVVSTKQPQLIRISPDGKAKPIVEGHVFEFPHDVVVDGQGNAYVTDGYAAAIWKISFSGQAAKWVSGAPLAGPVGISWRGTKMLVADPKAKNVFEITPDGKVTPLLKQ